MAKAICSIGLVLFMMGALVGCDEQRASSRRTGPRTSRRPVKPSGPSRSQAPSPSQTEGTATTAPEHVSEALVEASQTHQEAAEKQSQSLGELCVAGLDTLRSLLQCNYAGERRPELERKAEQVQAAKDEFQEIRTRGSMQGISDPGTAVRNQHQQSEGGVR
jgi:hypothetical protein